MLLWFLMADEPKKVITRMAPSPTGKFHVGGVRTALYNYLYARKHGGTFILRIEDTDKERSKKEFEDDIFDAFDWLGMEYDAVFRQSERTELYQSYIKQMIENGHAFEGEASETSGKPVIRLKNPNKDITIDDQILGKVTMNTKDLGDFVIARDIDSPLYHLTVVIDDCHMNVTHVIRAQEHLANTPRQILIQEAINCVRPLYAHIPLVLAPDKSKLSKRHGATAVTEFRDLGYLPEAMLNFLAFIGWNPGGEQELFTKEQLITLFDLGQVQTGGGVFNIEKLNWFNKEYLQKKSSDEQIQYLAPAKKYLEEIAKTTINDVLWAKSVPLIIERIQVLSDVQKLAEQKGEFVYLFKQPAEYNKDEIFWKKDTPEKSCELLVATFDLIKNFNGEWTKDSITALLMPVAETQGKGSVLWPLRYALSGTKESMDPFTLLSVLGKTESLSRIKNALQYTYDTAVTA